jgi:hypothetical protein
MSLFVGIDIEPFYSETYLNETITKYNENTGEPYIVDAGLYKYTVGNLSFKANHIIKYEWAAHNLEIIHATKPYYNCRQHKSQLDYYVGVSLPNTHNYNIGEWNSYWNRRDDRDLILFKGIESTIQLAKEKLAVITSNPEIVVLYKEDIKTYHEGSLAIDYA